jgi:hypothetical protein
VQSINGFVSGIMLPAQRLAAEQERKERPTTPFCRTEVKWGHNNDPRLRLAGNEYGDKTSVRRSFPAGSSRQKPKHCVATVRTLGAGKQRETEAITSVYGGSPK